MKVYDATPDLASHTFKINDITNFPFVPYNSERAFGIDVKTNNQSNVYATGFFSGDIQFLNAFSCAQDEFNVYLVRFDKCGNVIWDLVIGQNTGSCQVTSMSVDNSKASEWVTICGRFWGTITFPGGFQLVNTNTNSQISNAYAARFNKNGDFEWAAKMDGPGNGDVTAKGVTADDNGNIIVMGDFDDSPMYVRNAQGNIVSVLSNLGNTDNYYIMYDHYGDVSFYNSSLLSSVNDDEAGGLNHYYDQNTQCTEVFFTGRKNGNGFLGKRFTLTPSPTITFTQSNEYTIPGPIYIPIPLLYSGHFGKSVDTYVNQTNGVRTIFFSGKSINQVNTGSEPFLFYSLQPAPSSTPVQLDKGYHYVAQVAQLQNSSTDLAIRQSSGELYMGGYTKEPGNYPAYPGMGGYINGVNDFFIFKSAIYSNAAGVTVPQQWGVPVNSDASHTAVFELGQSVPEFFSVCVDENLPCPGYGQGRAYITGSYNSSLSSNQLAAGISFPVKQVVALTFDPGVFVRVEIGGYYRVVETAIGAVCPSLLSIGGVLPRYGLKDAEGCETATVANAELYGVHEGQ